jgi:hypothetical protein
MKKILILICCIALFKTASAQKDSLAFDEHGKYIYYKVIANKGDANVLLVRGLDFFDMPSKYLNFKVTAKDANTHTFEVKGFFVVSKASSLAKHDDGKIAYTFKVETRDQKYRYWVTGFVFTPYYRDRYNNYVPQTGVDIPMEEITEKVETRDANHYLDECAKFAKQLGNKLAQYIATAAVPKVKKDTVGKKVIDTKKW